MVKGRLIELDDELIKDAAQTSPPIPDHFLPLKKRSYLKNACPTSRWHSRPLHFLPGVVRAHLAEESPGKHILEGTEARGSKTLD